MLRATFALVALCLGLSFVAAQPPVPAPAVTMDDIKKAWQERQDKVKTLKMSWKNEATIPKGSRDYDANPRKGIHAPQPPRDLIGLGGGDFLLAGGGYKHVGRYEGWSVPKQAKIVYSVVATYDGTKHYQYLPSADELRPGTAYRGQLKEVTGELLAVEMYPLWWVFRGTDPKLGRSILDTYEPTGRPVVVRSRPCVELSYRGRAGGRQTTLYLDVDRGFVPVRYAVATGDIQNVLLDIDSTRDASGLWLPSEWRYALSYAKNKTQESLKCRVIRLEVNPTVSERDLAPDLAPGTLVVEGSGAGESVSLIRPDGREGQSFAATPDLTYDKLQALSTASPFGAYRWRLWAGVGLAVLSLAGLLRTLRRRPGRGDGTPPPRPEVSS